MQRNQDIQRYRTDEPCVGSWELINLIDQIGGKYGHENPEDAAGNNCSIQGVPVAAGVAVGRAAVIRNPEDLQKVGPDSILICPRMVPVYSIVFGRVRGVVAETGGVLTTAGAVAREYGLPAVTRVENARSAIGDGDIIQIDGTDGSIQIMSKAL